MSTLKGTTMYPRCHHTGACWDLLEWFQLFSTSQYTSRIQFRTFLKKKNQIFWFPCCSSCEDLSIDVSITNVGLILTKPGQFFLGIRKLGVRTEFNFVNFKLFEKFSHFWVSKGDFSSSSKDKFRIPNFIEKKFKFSGFHGVVLVKTFPLMYQLLM